MHTNVNCQNVRIAQLFLDPLPRRAQKGLARGLSERVGADGQAGMGVKHMVSMRILAKALLQRVLLSKCVANIITYIHAYENRCFGPYPMSVLIETYRRIDDEVRRRGLQNWDYHFQEVFWKAFDDVWKERLARQAASSPQGRRESALREIGS